VLVVRYEHEEPLDVELPKHKRRRDGSPDCEKQVEALQEIVDGTFEACLPSHFRPPSNICLFINAGPLDRCPPYNRWGIFGNFLFIKHNAYGTCVSLSDTDLAWCRKMLAESRGLLDPECRTLCQVAKDNEPPRGWIPDSKKLSAPQARIETPEWRDAPGIKGLPEWQYPVRFNPEILEHVGATKLDEIVREIQSSGNLRTEEPGGYVESLKSVYDGLELASYLTTLPSEYGSHDLVMLLDTAARMESCCAVFGSPRDFSPPGVEGQHRFNRLKKEDT
jgi:hypothetical protein